ncbi:MAG TPA: CHAT domain-containing tetratricopeptide repeat protein [Thermoanaerobaculia bacterium]|nr:CHAT domain-containing tetratricopeptide repeat protein [Thermoanaerobaculia bacterium]
MLWPSLFLAAGVLLGSPRLAEIGPGGAHTYPADLTAGRAWLVEVDQRGVDVTVEIAGTAVDNPVDRQGAESLLVEPETSGAYEIVVRAREAGAPPGRYEIRLVEVSGERRLEALRAVTKAGRLYLEGSAEAKRQAIGAWREALGAWRALGERREEARALYALTVLSRLVNEPREGVVFGREALPVWQSLEDRLWEAATWNEVGLDLWTLGEAVEARASFERALALQRQIDDRYGQAVSLSNLCLMDLARGELRGGLACYEQALPLLEAAQAGALAGSALTNVGRVYDVLGEPDQALASYGQALARMRATGNRAGEARTLSNLGVLSLETGDVQEALAHSGQALALFRELADRRWEARVLGNLGALYQSLGEPRRALAHYEEALRLWRETQDRAGEAATLGNLGLVHALLGDPRKALEVHGQALEIWRGAGDRRGEGTALLNLGKAQLALAEPGAALASFGTAVERLHAAGDLAAEADALAGQGRALLALGDPEKGLAPLTRALELTRAARAPASEAQVLSSLAQAERLLGRGAEARRRSGEVLDVIEKLRTRIGNPDLLASFSALAHQAYELHRDLLMEAHRAAPGAGWDKAALETSERARARTLVELLAEARVDIRQGVDTGLLDRRAALERRLSAKAQRALAEEQETLLRDLDLVDAEIREKSPGYAALTQPRPLTAAEIQALLDPATLLLSYSLGAERSWLWAVTAGSVESFELPGRAAIEDAARRLHQRLSTFDVEDRGEEAREAAGLSKILLGPVADRLAGKRLAIVADGALHYLPFAAVPGIAEPEIVYLPSASALAVQRRTLAGRPPAPKRLAVLADPAFAPGGGFERLPASREEAEAVAALAPPGQAEVALGFAADRSRALDDRLRGFRVVHFATHGVLDTERPALSGLALSTVDERGQAREGFLHLRDVYNLRLDADLVVLSGCQTALGREVRGEGLIGLTRGFQYAGAARVVASLWRVEDRATAALMTHFYRAMWEEGLSPAAALRQAQLRLRGERRWRDPYFWAGFILEGDWK